MRNYLAAECYKTFHRKYFYIVLAVCLGLELVLLGGCWLTLSWGNPNVTFSSTAVLVPFLLGMGLCAPLITGDIVFSDQYKHNTLKNEVSYGVPRARIYLGKHFPMDLVWGTLVGSVLGYAALRGYRRLTQSRNRRFTHPR